jgi:Rrf2 family protein
MKLSLRGEYAMRALVGLGDSYDGDVVPMQVISDQQEIPKRFLEQILNELRAGGFVESKRGIAGGYRLAQPPEEITLAQVVRHIEGTLAPGTDSSHRRPGLNPEAGGAQLAIRGVMRDAYQAMVKVLNEVTVAELRNRARQLRAELASATDYAI